MFKIILLVSRRPVLLCFLHTQHLMARVLLCWAELAEAMFHGSDKCLMLVFSILDTNFLDRSTCQVLRFGYLFHFLSQEYLRKHSGTCGKNSNSGLISKERKHFWSKENSTRGSPSNENVSSLILFLSESCSSPVCLRGHNLPEAQTEKSSRDTQCFKPCCSLSKGILFPDHGTSSFFPSLLSPSLPLLPPPPTQNPSSA